MPALPGCASGIESVTRGVSALQILRCKGIAVNNYNITLYAWFIRKKLGTDAMRSAISHIIGSHDFKSFEGTGSPRSHTTRTIMAAELNEQADGLLIFQTEADGFLRYMVRNIVGTLVDVGLGKITSSGFKDILESKDRNNASATAPAHGLFLMEVKY